MILAGKAPGRCFVAQLHRRVVDVAHSKMTTDLFRAPPLRQQLRDRVEQFGVSVDPPPVVAGASVDGLLVGLVWSIRAGGGRVSFEFAVDRRRCPVQLFCDLRDADTVAM